MNLIDFLYGPIANALGWTLLHALWQGFALVLPTAVVLHLLRHRSSTLRYQVGVVALLVQLLVSAATFLWYYEPAMTAVQATTYPASLNVLPVRWQSVTHALPWHQQVQHFLQIHLSQFVLVYLIGVGLFGLRLAGGWLYLQRLSQTATQPATLACTELTNTLQSAMAIRSVVRVRESARIAVPMVVGVLKPVLLLPIGLAANLSIRDVEAVVAHELAHIKRHDYAVNLLQSLMEVLYFFHPALWWLSARVREEREHCCDDLAVLAIGGDGRILAQALARVEELRLTQTGASPALAMAFAAKRQHLLHRVRRMLGVPTRPFVSNSSLAGLTLATVLLVSVSVYALQPSLPKPLKKINAVVRYKAGNKTEFGISDGQAINYVIWKGQRLPKAHIARLQREWSQTLTGQTNLDDVAQRDRDILLEIIEKQYTVRSGIDVPSGLNSILSDTILNATLRDRPDTPNLPDGTLAGLKAVNYRSIVDNSLARVLTLQPISDSLKRVAAQKKLDSLTAAINTVMEARKEAIDRISKEMADLTLKNMEFQKQLVPTREQAGLIGQQARLAGEIARLSLKNDAKSRTLLRQNEQKMVRLEKDMQAKMRQFEKQVEQQQRQIQTSSAYTDRLSALGDSMSRLMEPVTAISEQIGELSGHIAEDAMRQADEAMRLIDEVNANRPVLPRAPRTPRPPRTLRGAVRPVLPVAPVPPANVPVRPKPAPRLVPNVKPVPAPPKP